ncbi:MAG TPA: EAL domain-containing protein [Pilimelia sp.]|nr:EAL domain-containing protein [Pilimelia sp.]
MSTRKLLALYWAWLAALAATFFLRPQWHLGVWVAIGLTSVAAVLLGIRRNRPGARAPWFVLAAALFVFTAGDTSYNVLTTVLEQENPFPSVADALYLGMVPLLTGGLIGLARSGVAGRDRASLLDALTVTLGLGLLSWIFLIQPYVQTPGLTVPERLVSIAYPLGDILILLTVIRLLATARASTSVALLTLGAAGLLVADVAYGLSQLAGTWEVGGAVDAGWILFYAAWGAAALHPSMLRLTQPRVVRQSEIGPRRLALLATASMMAPGVLFVQALSGTVRDGVMISVLSAVLFGLVLSRLAGVATTHRQAVVRERAVREAGATLVSAADADQVRAAVLAALEQLMPAGTGHLAILDLDGAGAPEAAGRHARLAAQIVPVDDLPAPLAARLADFTAVLRCPLALANRPGGGLVGELLVAAPARALAALDRSVEVLAAQAALALERISLSAEVNRRISEEYFRTLVHNSTDVILILGDGARVRYASPSAARVLGHQTLTGADLLSLVDPEDRGRAGFMLDGVTDGELGTEYADWTIVRADGGRVEVEVSCRDLRADPSVGGLVVTLRDVTERRRLESELSHRALHDSLTGLANRVLFHDRTHRAVQRAQRNGTLAGVLFIDLDDFKVINDSLGHERGDELLVAVGQRLSEVLRQHDTAARLGGDEFAILVEDATHPADIEQVAERVLASLAEPVDVRGEMLSSQASVGVGISADARDAADLLRQADLALYLAKSEGKQQWRRYETTLHTALLKRLELRAALEQAVADEAFVLHFQPIVDLATGAGLGVEALVRWNDPQRGMVPPNDFISTAEDTGLIVPIGAWVLRTALETLAGWTRDAPQAWAEQYVSVNVSARQFRTPGFVEQVRDALADAGLPARCLLLEITESLLLRDDDQVWNDLATLRALGVRIAIDDFGTGYSSLSYLRQAPIDIVKIDRSFINGMEASPQQAALVDGIVRLAHTLGLEVVAEGIEQEAARDALLAMGCRLGQGFLFARPMPAADAARWVAPRQVAA